MLSLQRSLEHKGRCVPNILPCKIDYNGSANVSRRYWNPIKGKDGGKVAHFRGRKLYGRSAKIPEGYRGILVRSTDRACDKFQRIDDLDDKEDEEMSIEARKLVEEAEFEEIVVWGHEVLPADLDDVYIKGIKEWIKFAEQIHAFENTKDSSDMAPARV